MDDNLHSLPRQLIELRMEHADLDDLTLRRLKKRRLGLRDRIMRIEAELEPRQPA